MQWAVAEEGARIVNTSLSGLDAPGFDPLEEAVSTLTAPKGALFVLAAGNEGPLAGSIGSPSSNAAALTVGAVDLRGSAQSSAGCRIRVAARKHRRCERQHGRAHDHSSLRARRSLRHPLEQRSARPECPFLPSVAPRPCRGATRQRSLDRSPEARRPSAKASRKPLPPARAAPARWRHGDRIVIDGLSPSYLGPPESYHHARGSGGR
jgi:hypothetical protein